MPSSLEEKILMDKARAASIAWTKAEDTFRIAKRTYETARLELLIAEENLKVCKEQQNKAWEDYWALRDRITW